MQPITNTEQYHGKVGFDPLAYKLIIIQDEWTEEGSPLLYVADEFHQGRGINQAASDLLDTVKDVSACAHCGKSMSAIRYVAYAQHKASGEVVAFGAICANELGFENEYKLALYRAEKARQAAKEREAINAKRNEWNAANPEQAAALDAYEADIEAGGEHDEFLDSLSKGRKVYGSLTEKQTPWPTKALAKRAEWAAKKAEQEAKMVDVPALAEGRYTITGIVISTKWVEDNFGYGEGTLKMLVEAQDGNRVYGTVPSKLNVNKGDVVEFTAAVERSQDDEHFGFYKRPTKASVIDAAEEA